MIVRQIEDTEAGKLTVQTVFHDDELAKIKASGPGWRDRIRKLIRKTIIEEVFGEATYDRAKAPDPKTVEKYPPELVAEIQKVLEEEPDFLTPTEAETLTLRLGLDRLQLAPGFEWNVNLTRTGEEVAEIRDVKKSGIYTIENNALHKLYWKKKREEHRASTA